MVPQNILRFDSDTWMNMYNGASKYNCYALCRNSSSFILNMSPADTIGQLFHHVLLDEECALYACRLKGRFTPQPSEPRPLNPIAQVLLYGDDMVGTQSVSDKAPGPRPKSTEGFTLVFNSRLLVVGFLKECHNSGLLKTKTKIM